MAATEALKGQGGWMTLIEWRCEGCGRLLMETNAVPGMVNKMKCPKCGALNVLRVAPPVGERPPMPGYEKRAS